MFPSELFDGFLQSTLGDNDSASPESLQANDFLSEEFDFGYESSGAVYPRKNFVNDIGSPARHNPMYALGRVSLMALILSLESHGEILSMLLLEPKSKLYPNLDTYEEFGYLFAIMFLPFSVICDDVVSNLVGFDDCEPVDDSALVVKHLLESLLGISKLGAILIPLVLLLTNTQHFLLIELLSFYECVHDPHVPLLHLITLQPVDFLELAIAAGTFLRLDLVELRDVVLVLLDKVFLVGILVLGFVVF